jgi:ParB family chromosome partitioning protein
MYVIETNLMQRGFSDLATSEKAAVVALRHSKMFTEEKRLAIANEIAVLDGNSLVGNLQSGNSESAMQDTNSLLGNFDVKSKLAAVGNEYGLCKNTIARLIRIDKLTDSIKTKIDSGALSIYAGVELSYIPNNAQEILYKLVSDSDSENKPSIKIDISAARAIREAFKDKAKASNAEQTIKNILQGKTEQKAKPKPVKIKPKVYQ